MAKKKLSEMTPIERVDQRMKGMTWEEAEDVGVEILARCLAFHILARKENEEYITNLMERICKRAHEWSKEEGNAFILALARIANDNPKE